MLEQIPPATRSLLLANVIAFFLFQWLGPSASVDFMLWPWGEFPALDPRGMPTTVGFLPWQVVSYGFLHGGFEHLFFNMLALFMFGAQIELVWGQQRFLTYYFTCMVGAGFIQLGVASWSAYRGAGIYPTVGASGGVFGILLAYAILFPNRRVLLLIPPIPMRARTLVVLYGLLELYLGVTGTQTGVAHFAHLGGMAFGYGLIQYWRGRWPFDRRR